MGYHLRREEISIRNHRTGIFCLYQAPLLVSGMWVLGLLSGSGNGGATGDQWSDFKSDFKDESEG